MEIEKLNLYRDTNWNDIKLRFCGHSECLPLHSYGPGTRPYYLMHFVLSGKGRLVVNKTEYQITENQLFLVEPDQMVFYQADKEDPWTYSWVGFNGKLAPYFMHRLGFGYPSLTKELSTEIFEEIKDLLDILISIKNNNTKNDLYTNGILLLLLSKVGTFIEDSKELPERKSRQNSESHVQRAISIVEDFYGRDLTVGHDFPILHDFISGSSLESLLSRTDFLQRDGCSIRIQIRFLYCYFLWKSEYREDA